MSTPMNSGVYSISTHNDGYITYGVSTDIASTMLQHLDSLKAHSHPDALLQQAWNDHGLSGIRFSTVCTGPVLNTVPTKERIVSPTPVTERMKYFYRNAGEQMLPHELPAYDD